MATVADVEADLLIALRAIAGVQSGGDFRIRDGDVSFDVDYVGGSSSRLTLEAASSRARSPGHACRATRTRTRASSKSARRRSSG
jgi:hypothetical protein